MTRGEQALFLLAGKILPGPPFFRVAAQALATRADCRWAGVGELRDDGRSVDLLAFWDRDHQAEPFSFQLEGSPCLQVYRSKPDDPHQFFPCDVANRFADFPLLAQIGARSYRGEVFHDSVERPIGHVFVISEKDEADDEGLREFFRLVAQRVGSEYNRWRAEEALARSEKTLRWYESMAATTSDRMALIDTSYTYRAVNSSYLKSAPYRSPKDRIRAREDVVGQTIDEVLEPTFARQVVRRNLDRCFAGHSFNLEGWVQGPGHQSRYLQRSFRPYRSEEGTILGAVVTVRDLTRRQQQLAKINRLAVHEAVAAGDLFAAARQITEEATDLLGVE
ncbi:MAG: PAS domain-containing protein, partial [Acidobacteriota bacterium]